MTTGLDIVAVAARTPVGLAAESSAAAVRAGIQRLREFPYVTLEGEPIVVASDPRLAPELEGVARLVPMGGAVIAEVRRKLGAVDLTRGGCDVLVALPEERPGFGPADAAHVVAALGRALAEHGIAARVVEGGRGHAGALAAIERAASLVRARAGLVLVLGLDSYVHVRTFDWLEARRQLAQPKVRAGFVPGEAAAALVLAPTAARRALGLPSLGTVAGVATSREERLRGDEVGSLGEGTADAVLRAAGALSLPSQAADAVYCDLNGERHRSEDWAFFALRAHRAVRRLEYQAPSDSWGDVGAAFGVLGGVLAVQSFARRYAPGPRALVMAGSEGGLRGAMVVQAPEG